MSPVNPTSLGQRTLVPTSHGTGWLRNPRTARIRPINWQVRDGQWSMVATKRDRMPLFVARGRALRRLPALGAGTSLNAGPSDPRAAVGCRLQLAVGLGYLRNGP